MTQCTKEGYRVIVTELQNPDVELYSPYHLIQYFHACTDLTLRDERDICSVGVVVVISGIHLSGSHAVKWDVTALKAATAVSHVSNANNKELPNTHSVLK